MLTLIMYNDQFSTIKPLGLLLGPFQPYECPYQPDVFAQPASMDKTLTLGKFHYHQPSVGDYMNTPVTLSLVALITFGIVQYLRKVAGAHRAYGPSYMIVSAAFLALAGIFIHIIQRHPFDLSPKMVGLASIGGIIAGLGILAMLLAFRLGGEGSVLFPIAGLGVIVAIALSIIAFREPVTATKLIGVALGVGAIILLSR